MHHRRYLLEVFLRYGYLLWSVYPLLLGASAGNLSQGLPYSRKMWPELNLADCLKPTRTKILADNQSWPRYAPALGTCPRAAARRDTTTTSNMECELAMDSCIKGHHIFKNIWTPAIGEQLPCRRQISNNKDWYTVAILWDCTIDLYPLWCNMM